MAGGLGGGWEETGARSQKEVGANAGSWKEGGGQAPGGGKGWRAGRRRRVEIGGWSRGAGARRRWRVEGRAERRKPRGEREGGGRRLEAGAQAGAQVGAQAGD